MADTADHRVQNQFLFTAPYISMARLYTKMAAVFRNYVIICTRNDVIENALLPDFSTVRPVGRCSLPVAYAMAGAHKDPLFLASNAQ